MESDNKSAEEMRRMVEENRKAIDRVKEELKRLKVQMRVSEPESEEDPPIRKSQ